MANRVAVRRQSEVSIDFWKVLGHEVFSPERSLNQPKATCVCIRSINQSNCSIFVRSLFLFCSRAFISRSYENHSYFRVIAFQFLLLFIRFPAIRIPVYIAPKCGTPLWHETYPICVGHSTFEVGTAQFRLHFFFALFILVSMYLARKC